jgi:hypothetical protein
MVRGVVDTPGPVRVTTVSDELGTRYSVSVAEAEIGQVVVKQGRTARPLRTILAAVSTRDKHRYTLDIVTKGGSYAGPNEIES